MIPALFFTLHLLDATTTHVGLSRGFREGVLPTQQAGVIWAIEGSAAAGETLVWQRLRVRHPRLARALAVAVIAGEGGAVAWNARQLAMRR